MADDKKSEEVKKKTFTPEARRIIEKFIKNYKELHPDWKERLERTRRERAEREGKPVRTATVRKPENAETSLKKDEVVVSAKKEEKPTYTKEQWIEEVKKTGSEMNARAVKYAEIKGRGFKSGVTKSGKTKEDRLGEFFADEMIKDESGKAYEISALMSNPDYEKIISSYTTEQKAELVADLQEMDAEPELVFDLVERYAPQLITEEETIEIEEPTKAPKTPEPKTPKNPTSKPAAKKVAAASASGDSILTSRVEDLEENPTLTKEQWIEAVKTDKEMQARAEKYAEIVGKGFKKGTTKTGATYEDRLADFFADAMTKDEDGKAYEILNLITSPDFETTMSSYTKEQKQQLITDLQNIGADSPFLVSFVDDYAPELLIEEGEAEMETPADVIELSAGDEVPLTSGIGGVPDTDVDPVDDDVDDLTEEISLEGDIAAAEIPALTKEEWIARIKSAPVDDLRGPAAVYARMAGKKFDNVDDLAAFYADALVEYGKGINPTLNKAIELAREVYEFETPDKDFSKDFSALKKNDKIKFINRLVEVCTKEEYDPEFVYSFVEHFAPELLPELSDGFDETEVVVAGASTMKLSKNFEAPKPKDFSFTHEGKDFKGLQQQLSLDKIEGGAGISQSLAIVTDQPDSNLLLAVQRKGKTVASFEEIKDGDSAGKVKLTLSDEFVNEMKAENPDISLTSGEIVLDRVLFSQTKGLEVAQVGGAGKDLSIILSALGVQIKDKNDKVVRKSTKEGDTISPYNIVMTQTGYRSFLEQQHGMSADCKEPLYSNCLVQSLELERMNHPEKKNEPIYLNYTVQKPVKNREGEIVTKETPVQLISMPIQDEKNGLVYLNMIKEDGKEYLYIHSSNEASGRTTQAQRFQIRDMGIEMDNTKKQSLVIGVGKGGDVRYMKIPLPDAQVKPTVGLLSTDFHNSLVAKEHITDVDKMYSLDGDTPRTITVGSETYHVFRPAARHDAKIISYDGLAKVFIDEEKHDETEVEKRRRLRKLELEDVIDDDTVDPPPPPPEKKKKKKKKLKLLKPTKRNYDFITGMAILAVLCILISVFIPFMQTVGIVFAMTSLTAYVQPWNAIIHAINAWRLFHNWRVERYEKKMAKQAKKEAEIAKGKGKTKGKEVVTAKAAKKPKKAKGGIIASEALADEAEEEAIDEVVTDLSDEISTSVLAETTEEAIAPESAVIEEEAEIETTAENRVVTENITPKSTKTSKNKPVTEDLSEDDLGNIFGDFTGVKQVKETEETSRSIFENLSKEEQKKLKKVKKAKVSSFGK